MSKPSVTPERLDAGPIAGGVSNLWLVAWGAVVAFGFFSLHAYSFIPGDRISSVVQQPTGSAIGISGTRSTLLVFLHPKCPCSRATMVELTKLCSEWDDVDVRVVFYLPGDQSESWAHTGLWRSAVPLSNTPPLLDRDGQQCAAYGVTTSGHILLVSKTGRVLYSGGITDGRGHEGDNPGLSALVQALNGSSAELRHLPVFGCPISTEEGRTDAG